MPDLIDPTEMKKVVEDRGLFSAFLSAFIRNPFTIGNLGLTIFVCYLLQAQPDKIQALNDKIQERYERSLEKRDTAIVKLADSVDQMTKELTKLHK